jgi:hypothetical protein
MAVYDNIFKLFKLMFLFVVKFSTILLSNCLEHFSEL